MKTQFILLLSIGLILLPSCLKSQTTKQYFEECAEIELAKKLIDTYLEQDWDTYRSCYSDTARIWQNEWYTSDQGINIDQEMNASKEFVSDLEYYTYEETIWEMIINNAGHKWVHFWGKWVGKLNPESDELVVPVHIAFGIVDNKIVFEAGFWDNLTMYLAKQSEEKKK